MYSDSVINMGEVAKKKYAFFEQSAIGYLIASILAGVYVGFGIVLIFAIGAPIAGAESYLLKLLMGVSFGIALTLVVFAGAELFTGNAMIMTFGILQKQVSISNLVKIWGWSWVGNLLGSMLLAYIVVLSGSINHAGAFIEKISAMKMNLPIVQMVFRGILCNWLVCLALWTASRTKSDAAKCILIFWCLFAFISSGYEHSIANMTLFSLSLFAPHSAAVSWTGFAANLFWVTIGNIIGGSLCVAFLYWVTTRQKKAA